MHVKDAVKRDLPKETPKPAALKAKAEAAPPLKENAIMKLKITDIDSQGARRLDSRRRPSTRTSLERPDPPGHPAPLL